MKKFIFIASMLCFLATFAKAADHKAVLNKKPVKQSAKHVGAFLKLVTLTSAVNVTCTNGNTITTAYVFTTVDEDTGVIVKVAYENTGQTCGSNPAPQS